MLYCKESFRHFGLITKNLVIILFQSLLVALPLIIFKGITHQIHSYLPLQSIQLTKEVMSQSFPSNIWHTYSSVLFGDSGKALTMQLSLKR